MTSYGEVRLTERRLTINKDSIRPFSQAAGIHCRDYSLSVQRRIVDFAADSSFAHATLKLKEHYGITVPEPSVRAITLKHARCMEEIDDSLSSDDQPCMGEGKQLIGEMDGSMIPVIRVDENGTGDKRKTRKTEWQEARLCLVYEEGSTEKRHAVTLGNVDEAGKRWLGCAIRQGLNRQSKIHCVSDGAPWIASQAARVFARQGSYFVDFYHTSDYLAAAAKECAGPSTAERKHWLEKQQDRMKRGDLECVMADLELSRNKKKGDGANASERCHRYLRNRPGQFDYCAARAAGLPIGSGAIESAHRSVVQNRLKIPGAWWKVDNASSMLALRRMRADGEWERYWQRSESSTAHF